MFKEKSSKKRIITAQNAKEASTLDAKHQNMLNTIAKKQEQLSDLIEQQSTLADQLAQYTEIIRDMKYNGLIDTPEYDLAWSSNIHIKEQLRNINKTIESLKNSKHEIEYYEDTANILFQYYNLLENQVTKSNTQTISLAPVRATKGRKKLLPVATKSILEALQITPMQIDQSPVQTQGFDKSSLVDDYLIAIDSNYVKKQCSDNIGLCDECNIPLICIQQDGIMVCSQCGYQELLLVEQNRPILQHSSKEASHLSYKRINHFYSLEWNSKHEKCVTC